MIETNYFNIENILRIYKYIFWDYDDTLSPTVLKKGFAYTRIFNDCHKELSNFILDHHLKFPGESRETKIPLYLKEFSKYRNNNKLPKLEELKNKFSVECIDILSEIPIYKNIEVFLKNNKKNNFIITNMPQREIELILRKKSLDHLFVEVIGDAINKTIIIQEITKSIKEINKCVFIGDSENDYKSAKNCGIDFILKTSKLNKNLQSIPGIKTL